MRDEAAIVKVRTLARDLAQVALPDDRALAVGGLVVGAAYSLVRALEQEYTDTTGTKRTDDYKQLLEQAAMAIADGEHVAPPQWLAPYYFNDSLVRLAVSRERLYTDEQPREREPTIRQEVNVFKHEFGGLFTKGRQIGVSEALRELETLIGELRNYAGR